MTKLFDTWQIDKNRLQHGFFDDLDWLVTAHRWTTLIADSGSSVAVGNLVGGQAVLTTGATNNNEAALFTTNSVVTFAQDKPAVCEGLVQYAEAATNAANVMFGWMSAIGANALQDDGVGVKTSFTGAVIYKLDGGTVWRCKCSVGTTNIDTITQHTAGGAAGQVLTIEFLPYSSTLADVLYYLNGAQMLDVNNRPIKHTFTFTSALAVMMGAYVKDGSGTGEVVNVDYMAYEQKR